MDAHIFYARYTRFWGFKHANSMTDEMKCDRKQMKEKSMGRSSLRSHLVPFNSSQISFLDIYRSFAHKMISFDILSSTISFSSSWICSNARPPFSFFCLCWPSVVKLWSRATYDYVSDMVFRLMLHQITTSCNISQFTSFRRWQDTYYRLIRVV